MEKIITKPAIKVIGIEVRTNNKSEMSGTGKIGSQWNKFFQENIAAKIPHQTRPQEIMAIYTDYESDANGEYSFIIGKEVGSFDTVPVGLVAKTLPASKYTVLTSRRGPMPTIVIELWQRIWSTSAEEMGFERAWLGDFEIYDSRSADPANSEVDVFLSIK